MLLEKTLETGLKDPTSPSWSKSVLNIHWKDWCCSWNPNTLATWCKVLSHWKRPWCWERLTAGGERDYRGWDCWMASLTWWTRVWVGSGSWWWTGEPSILQSMGLQRSDITEWMNWTGTSVSPLQLFCKSNNEKNCFKKLNPDNMLKWQKFNI